MRSSYFYNLMTGLLILNLIVPPQAVAANLSTMNLARQIKWSTEATTQEEFDKRILLLIQRLNSENASLGYVKNFVQVVATKTPQFSLASDLDYTSGRVEKNKKDDEDQEEDQQAKDKEEIKKFDPLDEAYELDAKQISAKRKDTLALEAFLQSAPEIRLSLRMYGAARTEEVAKDIDKLLEQRPGGLTPKDVDEAEESAVQRRYETESNASEIINQLRDVGLISANIHAENQILRETFRNSTTDELAERIISTSWQKAAMAGGAFGLTDRIGAKSTLLGEVGEAGITFGITANMIQRLADLYDLSLSDYETELYTTAFTAGVKAFAKISIDKSPLMNGIFEQMGKRFSLAKNAPKNAIAKLRKLAERLHASRGNPRAALEEDESSRGNEDNDESRNRSTGDDEVQDNSRTDNSDSAQTEETAKKKSRKRKATPKQLKSALKKDALGVAIITLQVLKSGALTAAEVKAYGLAAHHFFKGHLIQDRATSNESFRHFLVGDSGPGFFKLLINTLAADTKAIPVRYLESSDDKRVQFIFNLARSARMCSSSDLKLIKGEKSILQARTKEEIENQLAQHERLQRAKYACKIQDTRAFSRIRNEIVSFSALPMEFVVDLRKQDRNTRLRMAEIIVQLQSIDKDRSPSEIEYFKRVITPILGLQTLQDSRYFDNFSSYIRDNGMVVDFSSPSGHRINSTNNKVPSPYDMVYGYTSAETQANLPPPQQTTDE